MKLLTISLCVVFIIFSNNLFAQRHLKNFSNCSSLAIYEVYYGDTILIKCDTVYLMNKKKITGCKEVVKEQAEYIKFLNGRIDEQKMEYDRLKKVNDTLVIGSSEYINKSYKNLDDLKNSLDKSINYINTAQTDIADIKKDIKTELIKRDKNKFIWGAGGIVFGILIGIVAF